MSYLLHIDSASLLDADTISRRVARSFLDGWGGEVVHRDLGAAPVPHLSEAGATVRRVDPAQRTPEQAEAAALQDELVEEFLGARGYLFTVPMYNYSMPSVFKAWLDQIMIVGRTIVVPEGAGAAGRPGLVISSRGGGYGPGTPNHGMDHVVPTLETVLGPRSLGLDLTFITPELTLATEIPELAPLIGLHHASVADAHVQARKLAETCAS